MVYEQSSAYADQYKKQVTWMAIAFFVAIVAAITVSAVLVSSLVKSQVADALAQSNPVTTQAITSASPTITGTPSSACVGPQSSTSQGGGGSAMPGLTTSFARSAGAVSNSFNNTNTSTTTTTTNDYTNSFNAYGSNNTNSGHGRQVNVAIGNNNPDESYNTDNSVDNSVEDSYNPVTTVTDTSVTTTTATTSNVTSNIASNNTNSGNVFSAVDNDGNTVRI